MGEQVKMEEVVTLTEKTVNVVGFALTGKERFDRRQADEEDVTFVFCFV